MGSTLGRLWHSALVLLLFYVNKANTGVRWVHITTRNGSPWKSSPTPINTCKRWIFSILTIRSHYVRSFMDKGVLSYECDRAESPTTESVLRNTVQPILLRLRCVYYKSAASNASAAVSQARIVVSIECKGLYVGTRALLLNGFLTPSCRRCRKLVLLRCIFHRITKKK